jgi:hypothetical protein
MTSENDQLPVTSAGKSSLKTDHLPLVIDRIPRSHVQRNEKGKSLERGHLAVES